jgi:hypothetical protein
MEEQECLACNAYLCIQQSKKRHCWGSFLETANRDAVWQVLHYTNPCTTTAMGTIVDEHGNCTEEDQEKRCMMAAISFLAPNDYDGGEGYPGPPGIAYTLVTEELLQGSISHQSNSKAPGRDSLGVPIIKALLKWDPKQVTSLVANCLWLGFNLTDWKIAKGVYIPKPGKPSYDKAKNLQVISLLSCLGKLVENIAAILIAEAVEANESLHIGQF